LFFGGLLGLICCLLGVAREQALIKRLFGRQDRLVAQDHIKEFEMRNTPADHDKACCERRRQ